MIKILRRFVFVGVICLLLQVIILKILENFINPVIANTIGFIFSAQLNFILSYRYTWGESARKKGKGLVATWCGFMGVVLLSATINTCVFALIRYAIVDSSVIAAIGATATSTIFTFTMNHRIVLKPEKRSGHDHTARNSNVPAGVE